MRHLTAEDVYKILLTEGLDIGLATVYRVLTQFEQAGLLVRHHFESGKAVFELNEGKHHDHLVCMGFEAENEVRKRAFGNWQVTADMMRRARPDALFMPSCVSAKSPMQKPRAVAAMRAAMARSRGVHRS